MALRQSRKPHLAALRTVIRAETVRLAPGWMATESIARPFASIALSQARRAGARAAPIVIDTVSGPAAVLPSSVKPASAVLEARSEEHTSELQSLMRSTYAVFCLKKKKQQNLRTSITYTNIRNTDRK